ncbi:MAG: hypothetical protein ACLFUB_09630 [Cyclobacteriaceae bacterium]
MNFLKVLIGSLCLFIVTSSLCHAQNNDSISSVKVKKNVVQLTGGYLVFWAGFQLNYERQVLSFQKESLAGLWAKAGIGGWGVRANAGGPYQHLSLGLMSGHDNSHFELNLGLGRIYNKTGFANHDQIWGPEPANKSRYVDFYPVGALGYRYQKPDGHFLFRCGLGYPETLYMGIGAAF